MSNLEIAALLVWGILTIIATQIVYSFVEGYMRDRFVAIVVAAGVCIASTLTIDALLDHPWKKAQTQEIGIGTR